MILSLLNCIHQVDTVLEAVEALHYLRCDLVSAVVKTGNEITIKANAAFDSTKILPASEGPSSTTFHDKVKKALEAVEGLTAVTISSM